MDRSVKADRQLPCAQDGARGSEELRVAPSPALSTASRRTIAPPVHPSPPRPRPSDTPAEHLIGPATHPPILHSPGLGRPPYDHTTGLPSPSQQNIGYRFVKVHEEFCREREKKKGGNFGCCEMCVCVFEG